MLWILSVINAGPSSYDTNPFAILAVIGAAAGGVAVVGIIRQAIVAVRRSKALATRSSP